MKVLARNVTLEFETITAPTRPYTSYAAMQESGPPKEQSKAISRKVVVYLLDSGKFELNLEITTTIDNKLVKADNCSPAAQPVRWRAKTISELIALSHAGSSFRPSTLDQIRNAVYDAEDALKKDLDL